MWGVFCFLFIVTEGLESKWGCMGCDFVGGLGFLRDFKSGKWGWFL